MKKQTLKTKLTLNKFKIASISEFGKSKVFGGTGVNPDDDETGTDKPNKPPRPNSGLYCIEDNDEDNNIAG